MALGGEPPVAQRQLLPFASRGSYRCWEPPVQLNTDYSALTRTRPPLTAIIAARVRPGRRGWPLHCGAQDERRASEQGQSCVLAEGKAGSSAQALGMQAVWMARNDCNTVKTKFAITSGERSGELGWLRSVGWFGRTADRFASPGRPLASGPAGPAGLIPVSPTNTGTLIAPPVLLPDQD
jgi:hypothetical protein